MENISDVAEAVKPKSKKPQIKVEIDKTGPYVHVTIPEYSSWIALFVNDKKVNVYKLDDGKISIQLPGKLPREYRVEVKVLKK